MAETTASKFLPGLLGKWLSVLGPGLFLIGYNIGTGSVTTMASAGSKYGMSLGWTVLLSCVFMFIGIMLFGRYTLVTGQTILYAIRTQMKFGRAIGLFILGSLILAEFAGLAGLMAVLIDLLQEWCRHFLGYSGLNLKVGLTAAVSMVVFSILWKGQYSFLETLLAVLVGTMGVCFIATAVLVVPSWREVLSGLVPSIPNEPDAPLLVAGMAGTTFSAAALYCRSITIKAKGWGEEQKKRGWIDALVSAAAMFVLSIAVMVTAAGTLYVAGKSVENTIDMVRTLEPIAGDFALSLFVIGIFGAGLSSLIPTILIAPWLISDYRGSEIDPRSFASRFFVVLGIAVGVSGPFLSFKPVSLMLTTMALLVIVLPLSTVAITVLLNQKKLGKYKNTLPMNIACLATVAFSSIMAYYGVIGLINKINEWLAT